MNKNILISKLSKQITILMLIMMPALSNAQNKDSIFERVKSFDKVLFNLITGVSSYEIPVSGPPVLSCIGRDFPINFQIFYGGKKGTINITLIGSGQLQMDNLKMELLDISDQNAVFSVTNISENTRTKLWIKPSRYNENNRTLLDKAGIYGQQAGHDFIHSFHNECQYYF